MLPTDLKALYEAYNQVYSKDDDTVEITDDLIEEIVEELIEECVEDGYDLEEAAEIVEQAAIDYLDEAKVTYGSDTESPTQRAARAKQKHGAMKSAARKAVVQGAVSRVKAKVGGAKAAAGIAGSIAKDEARRAGRSAAHAAGKAASAVGGAAKSAAGAVSAAASKKKAQVKSGVKGLLKKGLSAVAGGAGRVAQASRKVGSAASKAADRLGEEVDIFDVVLEYLVAEGYADTNEKALVIMANMSEEWKQSILDEDANYDRNRRRAAQRAAARNEARKRGQTGSVPGVGYVSPRPERETYTDSSGVVRHHTGGRMPSKD